MLYGREEKRWNLDFDSVDRRPAGKVQSVNADREKCSGRRRRHFHDQLYALHKSSQGGSLALCWGFGYRPNFRYLSYFH